jgi:hypothetical protein
MRKKVNPWQVGLLATSALAAAVFAASLLWQQGHPEWAFVLSFSAVWALLSIVWANVDFTEDSGTLLARVVDHNFHHVHDRLEFLEQELDRLNRQVPQDFRKAS